MWRRTLVPGLCLLFLSTGLTLYLGGCRGSGGGGGAPPGPTTGTVTVLLADGPADDFDAILITVTEISLIPDDSDDDGDVVTIYEDSEGDEIDILDLRDEDLVFTVNDHVRAGRYSKIRMRVASITPVGGPCAQMKLPSGRIDLNFRGPLEIRGGESVTVHLDLDANKSIHIVEAGNSGKCIFRPVVFVDIERGQPVDLCPRIVAGTVKELLDDDDDEVTDGFIVELPGNRGELKVRLLYEDDGEGNPVLVTAIFDEDGLPSDEGALSVGDSVRVRGRLNDEAELEASLVVVGEVVVVKGIAEGPVQDGLFPFDPDPGQVVIDDEEINVEVADETLILAGCDQVLTADAILEGVRARVIGKISLAEGVLRAVAIIVCPAEVSGELVDWEYVAGGIELTLRPDAGEDFDVFVPEGVSVYLEGDGIVDPDLWPDVLCEGRQVRVLLHSDHLPLLRATQVRIQAEEVEGTILDGDDIDDTDRTLVLDDVTLVHVLPGATILIVTEDDEQTLGTFESILPGDTVKCFGLPVCSEPRDADFEAFVVLITRTEVPAPL